MRQIMILGLLVLFLAAACTTNDGNNAPQAHDNNGMAQGEQTGTGELPPWMTTQLTNVNSDESYTLADFKGQTVLVESFAIWCPTCSRQQEILKEMEGDVVHVSIDTDPNEDANKVKAHAQSKGFDWRYSVGPAEFTQSWIDEFGLKIVNAPSVPMILICEDQSYRLLASGLKQESELQEEITRGCNA